MGEKDLDACRPNERDGGIDRGELNDPCTAGWSVVETVLNRQQLSRLAAY